MALRALVPVVLFAVVLLSGCTSHATIATQSKAETGLIDRSVSCGTSAKLDIQVAAGPRGFLYVEVLDGAGHTAFQSSYNTGSDANEQLAGAKGTWHLVANVTSFQGEYVLDLSC